jgi:hypothetical protein
VVKGLENIDCGCAVVKNTGSQGFKIKVDTLKLTKKDAGEYLITADINLQDNSFAIQSQTFKLTIKVEEPVSEEEEIDAQSLNKNEAIATKSDTTVSDRFERDSSFIPPEDPEDSEPNIVPTY